MHGSGEVSSEQQRAPVCELELELNPVNPPTVRVGTGNTRDRAVRAGVCQQGGTGFRMLSGFDEQPVKACPLSWRGRIIFYLPCKP